MIEGNNGQSLSVAPCPARKRHNAKLCPLVISERIINALAAGDSKSSIAKALRVSRNTVTAIADREWLKVEQRKARIAAQAERAATRAYERINDKLDSKEDIPLNVLVPVAGVSVDKLLALRGDPLLAARIEHVHTGRNIFEEFRRFHEDCLQRLEANGDQLPTAPLALPNGNSDSSSGH